MHHRQRPLAGREHDRLVHPEAKRNVKADAELGTPEWRRSIRGIANARIDSVLGAVLDAAIEEIPEPPFRVDPQARVVATCAIIQRQTHRVRCGEGLAAIIAIREHDRVLRLGLFGASCKPRDKHTSLGRAFKSRNALPGALGEVDGDRFSGVQRGQRREQQSCDECEGEFHLHLVVGSQMRFFCASRKPWFVGWSFQISSFLMVVGAPTVKAFRSGLPLEAAWDATMA